MPANLTPEYLKAERVYKDAKTVEEKIAALEEMLRVIPKHKGTDHLQGDLRRRLSRLRQEAAKPQAKKGFNPYHVPKQGGGQVVLLGPPNAGKSSLVAATTNAHVQVAEYPFTTHGPAPAMLDFEDVQIQLVDLPPLTRHHVPPGMMGLVKSADGALLFADLGAGEVLEDLEGILEVLGEHRVHLYDPCRPPPEREVLRTCLPSLLLGSKADLPGAAEVLQILGDLYGDRFEPVPVSSRDRTGLDGLPGRLFRLLRRIRVYSKEPGKPPERSAPFVLEEGETVLDLAGKIHRDFPEHLRQARVWGSSRFDGQAVERDYRLADGDVVELHVDL